MFNKIEIEMIVLNSFHAVTVLNPSADCFMTKEKMNDGVRFLELTDGNLRNSKNVG